MSCISKAVLPGRRRPVCSLLSAAIPLLGLLATAGMAQLAVVKGKGDFSVFAPVIVMCIAALPIGLIGLAFSIAAFIRKERCLPALIPGVVLNLLAVALFAILIFGL